MRIALLSNVGIDTLAARLTKKYDVFIPNGYNVWIQAFIDPCSAFFSSGTTDCFVLLDGNNFNNPFNEAADSIKCAANHLPECNFFISNIDCSINEIQPINGETLKIEQEYQWYRIIHTLVNEYQNVNIFDLKQMIEKFGRNQCYSSKMWYASGNPYTAFMEKEIISKIQIILDARYRVKKKCLVLDLDNTLWGGVISEDGISGIQLDETKEGARFKDFQKKIKKMKDLGVILGVVSKNNIEDVKKAFTHPQMALSWDDFVIHKINWRPKSQNIAEIAEELNIGMDSIVFVDDNPVEREEVRHSLPDVVVADFPEDTCKRSQFADELYRAHFFKLHLSDEDKNKSRMYTENSLRKQSEHNFNGLDEFLTNMGIILKMRLAEVDMLPRINQLIQKTNQFNLTARRYSEQELQHMMVSPEYFVFAGYVADKFGDNGLTVLIILKSLSDKTVEIDTFLMSCRIMGRTIEYAAMAYLESFVKNKGMETVRAFYIPTKKNMPVAGFYETMGYALTKTYDDGTKEYSVSMLTKRTCKQHYVKLV